MIEISTRKEWGAKHGTGAPDPGPEENVVIHHSYSPAIAFTATPSQEAAAWRGIEEFHVKTNGWQGIGYNFGVAPSGRVYEGRGWKFRGAHAGPINGNSIGICLLIDGSITDPSGPMIQAVRDLIRLGIELKEISPDYKISGHRDWMANRTCPGDRVYRRLKEFRHDFEVPVVVPTGTRVWSNFYHEHLIVTRFVSNEEWYFALESLLQAAPATRAKTPFKQMPKAKW